MVLTDFEVQFQYTTPKMTKNAFCANAFFKIALWGNIFDAEIMFKIKKTLLSFFYFQIRKLFFKDWNFFFEFREKIKCFRMVLAPPPPNLGPP